MFIHTKTTDNPSYPTHFVARCNSRASIVGAFVVPNSALVADDGNFAELVWSLHRAGERVGTIARVTTEPVAQGGTGNWTPGVPFYLTLDNETELSAGDVVAFEVNPVGTGVLTGMLVTQLYIDRADS